MPKIGRLPYLGGKAALDDINQRAGKGLDQAIDKNKPKDVANILHSLLISQLNSPFPGSAHKKALLWICVMDGLVNLHLSQQETAQFLQQNKPALKALAATLAAEFKGRLATVAREYGKGIIRERL